MLLKKLFWIFIFIIGLNLKLLSQDEIIVVKVDDSELKFDLNKLKVIKVVNPTGVENDNKMNDILLFPNPTSDKLIIQTLQSEILNKKIKLKIFDIDSKLIKELTKVDNLNIISNNQLELNLVSLGLKTKGIYFLEIEVDNKKYINKLILE